MAIAFDAVTNTANVSATSLTFSHTCTGSNRILFVGVLGVDVTGITYNGVAMSLVNSGNGVAGINLYLYILVNPASGTNNVVVTQNTNGFLDASSTSYTGAAQSGQPDNKGTNFSVSGASNTVTVTTVADNCWLVSVSRDQNNNGTISAGANTTIRGVSQFCQMEDSNGAKHPAGSTSLTVTVPSSSNDFRQLLASFAPFVASSVNSNFLSFM